METIFQNGDNESSNEQLVLTAESVVYLQKIASWTTFFSILGFIFIGLMVIIGMVMTIFMAAVFAAAGKPYMVYMGIVYAVFAAIYIMPIIYLYRFSANAKNAVQYNNSNDMMTALKNLKSHFKYVGIFTIVILSIYLVAGIGFLLAKIIM